MKTIEINCLECGNCTGESCKVYGSDADKAVKRCADDSFKNYKPRMTRKEAAGVIERLPVMSYMKKNQKHTIITTALDIAIEALQEPERKWIPVSERLPEKEANEYIKNYMHGIGYLYPCLLTYLSPNTEKIHVVRFYYDIYEKWFVNNGEEPCEKDRCIAWQPLPEPYKAGEPK